MPSRAEFERLERTARRADEQHATQRPDPHAHQIMELQRSMGNAAVARMLARRRGKPEPKLEPPGGAAPSGMDSHRETQSTQISTAIRIGRPATQPHEARAAMPATHDLPKGETPHAILPAIEA